MTGPINPIRVSGLREFQAALKSMDGEAQKKLRLVLNEAAGIVVRTARPRVPAVTGAARASLKEMSSQREARVKAGTTKAPYYPWLDFGGRVGIKRSTNRPFERHGRYIYPAYSAQHKNIEKLLAKRLAQLATDHGLTVD